MKTWSAENPKASLMAEKRSAIVDAALRAFLESGYAQTSMDSIASAAGVSVKTIYRHFDNKDDLFVGVMQEACGRSDAGDGESEDDAEPSWFSAPPDVALVIAGKQYLVRILSATELAMYRVVVRDSPRFPVLGQRFRAYAIEHRYGVFSQYLERWKSKEKWKIEDLNRASETFSTLLRSQIYEAAVFSTAPTSDAEIAAQAKRASIAMLALLEAGVL